MSSLPPERRDLVRGLFELATEVLEDTHIVAADGHADRTSGRYVRHANSLKVAADQLSAIAAVITLTAKAR